MAVELLGYSIIRKSDGKKVAYIGVIPMLNKKVRDEYMDKFPTSRFIWVEYRHISSPKTSQIHYKR